MAKKKKMSKVKVPALSSEELKLSILRCAKQEFASHGYQGANLRDIAKCAGVAGSLINYHYKDKAGIFKACTELFAKARMDAVNRILNADPKTADEMKTRIELFVEEMFLSYIEDPNGFNMIQTEVRAENPVAMEMFKDTFMQTFNNACTFFDKAKANGVIGAQWDTLITAKLLFTLACESTNKDHIGKKFFNVTVYDEVWRKKLSEHIVAVFMNGVTK